MSFINKLMFWKKDDNLSFDPGLSGDPSLGMDTGMQDFGMGMPPSQGLPDASQYSGVGNSYDRQAMNQSIHQQLGPDYMNTPSALNTPQPAPFQAAAQQNDFQVISAKLDAVKATLDAINQRLGNLEHTSYSEGRRREVW